MRSLAVVLTLSVFTAGCGGCGSGNAYLPKPRSPEPEESESAATAASVAVGEANTPAGASVPSSAPVVASVPMASGSSPTTANRASSAWSVPQKPASELTETEHRKLAVDQLTRIGAALEKFRQQYKTYPSSSFYAGQLSWRVALLPFLGRSDLIVEKDEPWSHPANKKLLVRIPDEFKSLSHTDGKTTFVLITGEDTAYASRKGPGADDFPDGLGNTILVVQIDDAYAVPWTAPDDYVLTRESVQQALFNRHKDCCYVLFGDATGVRRIPPNISDEHLLALISPAGYESIPAAQITQPPSTEVDTNLIEQLAAKPIVRFPAPSPVVIPAAAAGQLTATRVNQSPNSVTGIAPAAPNTISSHVAKLLDALEQAMLAGCEQDALRLYYAAVMVSSQDDPWKYRMKWVSGLKRPVVAVRWGIGVAYTGPSDLSKDPNPIAKTSSTQLVALKPEAQPLRTYTGELGDRLFENLQDLVSNGQSGEFLTALSETDNQRPAAYQPRSSSALGPGEVVLLSRGVIYLGVGSDRVLEHLAQREGVDVLVTFDVQVKTVRNNQPYNTTTIVFKDMRSQEVLYSTPPLNNIRVELARRDPLQDDPVMDVVDKMSEYLDQHLSVTSIPVGISSENVAGRIAALRHPRHENPLPALAEVRFYRTQNLITAKQLADAYRVILGEEQGAQLAAGTEREKVQAIQQWLPKKAKLEF